MQIHSLRNFVSILLFTIIIEMVLGGSGRLVSLGPVTFKMYLCTIAILVSFLHILFYGKINQDFFLLLSSFTFLIIGGSINGLINGANISNILLDVKPLVYMYMLIFFYYTINYSNVFLIQKLIKVNVIVLSFLFLIFLYALLSGLIPFETFYILVDDNDRYSDIMFKGTEGFFFYKGFIYFVIGLFFFVFTSVKRKTIFVGYLILILLLTLVRGFLVDIVCTVFFYFIFIKKVKVKKHVLVIFLFFICSAIITFLFLMDDYATLIGDKTDSDHIRILQLQQVYERISFWSFFIGHGFGIGVPVREIHMEIAYLEIFHKQGIIGILFWVYFFFIATKDFFRIKQNRNLALPFYLAIIVIYVQSFTNPYLNNPIGMSINILSLVVLKVLLRQERVILYNNI